jgi:CubicO group peptidase (beta-lactamase class C family)
VLLAYHGRPVLVRAHGQANEQLSAPNRPDTIFALASVTKVFTGVAITHLAQQGNIGFHDTLGTYLPGFPARWQTP